jgi:hypothetical protein
MSGLVISGVRKKLADSTSVNPLILDFILTYLHLKYSNSYILQRLALKIREIPRNSMKFHVFLYTEFRVN